MQLRCDARVYNVDDQTFWEYTNVASQEFVSQEYETQDEAHLDMEEEGFLDATPNGRSAKYTTKEDKFTTTDPNSTDPSSLTGDCYALVMRVITDGLAKTHECYASQDSQHSLI